MSNLAHNIAQIKQLISKNKLEEAIQAMESLPNHTIDYDELLNQSAQLNAIRKKERRHLMTQETAFQKTAQVRMALLDILKEVAQNRSMDHPEIPAASKAKVINHSNIQGNNNITIQGIQGTNIHINSHKQVD